MFKLLSMLNVLAVSSSAAIGIVANSTHVNNTNVQTLKQDVKLTDKVYGGISPLGIQSEPVASTLLQSFVTNTKNKLAELGVLTWDLSNVDLSLTSTALTAKNNVLIHVVKDIISSGGQVVSETYQTTAAWSGQL